MAVTLSEAIIIQGASVVFAAGMVWAPPNVASLSFFLTAGTSGNIYYHYTYLITPAP